MDSKKIKDRSPNSRSLSADHNRSGSSTKSHQIFNMVTTQVGITQDPAIYASNMLKKMKGDSSPDMQRDSDEVASETSDR